MRRRHQEGTLLEHRVERRYHYVPQHQRETLEGNHRLGSIHYEGQGVSPAREEVLGLDRRVDSVLALDIPDNVDHQSRVSIDGFDNRAQEMFLIRVCIVFIINN